VGCTETSFHNIVLLIGTNNILQVGCTETSFHNIVLLIGTNDILHVSCTERSFKCFGGPTAFRNSSKEYVQYFVSFYSLQLSLIVSENRRITDVSNNVDSADGIT
jgi:hypothetical protein